MEQKFYIIMMHVFDENSDRESVPLAVYTSISLAEVVIEKLNEFIEKIFFYERAQNEKLITKEQRDKYIIDHTNNLFPLAGYDYDPYMSYNFKLIEVGNQFEDNKFNQFVFKNVNVRLHESLMNP